MASYTIGEVEQLTGIKTHVLRYWEEVIPLLSPRKDFGGRRVYSQREIDVIRRLKFLIYEKEFTIEGAYHQLINEAFVPEDRTKALDSVRRIRAELNEAFVSIQRSRARGEKKLRQGDGESEPDESKVLV